MISFVSNVVIAVRHRLPRRQARRRRPALHRRDRGARDPDLLQRRRHPEAPVPCLTTTCLRTPSAPPSRRPGHDDERPTRPRSRATTAAAGSGGRSGGRPAARSSWPCCWRWSASPASPRCAPTSVDDTYAGLREQDLIDILERPGRHHPARPGRDPAPGVDPRRPAVGHQARARPRWSRPDSRPQALSILAGTVPVRGPGRHDHDQGGVRPGRRRPVHRHGPGAAHRRGRGDADQRRGPGGRPDRRSRTAPAGCSSTAGCSSRRSPST